MSKRFKIAKVEENENYDESEGILGFDYMEEEDEEEYCDDPQIKFEEMLTNIYCEIGRYLTYRGYSV